MNSDPARSAKAKGTDRDRVVLVNDDVTQLELLRGLIEKGGFEVDAHVSAEAALHAMSAAPPPVLIITDVVMPDIDGWAFCRLLRSSEYADLNRTPILVVSSVFSEAEAHRIASDLGAEAFMTAPVDGEAFLEKIKTIVSQHQVRQAPRVLVVEDDPNSARMLEVFLRGEGYHVDVAPLVAQGAELFAAHSYDIAIIDFNLPDGTGDTLLEPFLQQKPDCTCLIITGDLQPELSLGWMKRGAAAYLSKPFEPAYLLELVIRARRERTLLRMPKMLEQRTEALRKSEERFRNVLNSVPSVAVQGYNAAGVTQYWNKASEALYGYTAEEAIGRNLLDLIIPPEIKSIVREEMAEMSRTGKAMQARELELMRKDGKRVAVFSSHSVVHTADGELELFCFDFDLTEQRQLSAELQQAQKMESIGRLAGGVAHDFNNMLGVILGHTEMLLETVEEDHPLHDDLSEIQKAARRSAELTRQLLAFARKQAVSPRVIDLNETIDGMLRRLIGEHITLHWNPAPKAGRVRMDPSQMDQILANLCVNARDAIDNTGVVTITCRHVSVERKDCTHHKGVLPGDFVQLTVEDDGTGMAAEVREHLFEPFFTTKPAGVGTGLGLATVYGIVQQNRGFIEVQSTVGKGTTFSIFLPLYRGADPAETTGTDAMKAEKTGETILLVEDEPAMLKIAFGLMRRCGYNVLCAQSPYVAIDIAEKQGNEIDLLLTDVVMPGMNGQELSQKLIARFPKLKCLFMSGYSADVIARHGVLEEHVNFIHKPFNLAQLTAAVKAVLSDVPVSS
jgi:PAS domain S-box-containing protein